MSEKNDWLTHALQKPGTRLFAGAIVVLVIVAAVVLVLQLQSPTTLPPAGSTPSGSTVVTPITSDAQANEKMDEISNKLISATSEIDNLIGTIGQ